MGSGYSIRAKGTASAEIYIYEDVGEGWFGGVSAKQFATDLKALGSVQTIDVRINSYGGEVFDGLAMYRQLVEHPARIVVHIDGVAASIASVIAMAGDEIRIAEAAFIMIHPAQGGVLGPATDMREMADLLDKITDSIVTVYERRTGAARDQISAWVEADTWFNGAEALAAGFVDVVDENMLLAARADMQSHRDKFSEMQRAAIGNRQIVRPSAQEVARLREAAGLIAVDDAGRSAPTIAAPARPLFDSAAAKIARMRAHFDLRRANEVRTA